jgi:hypothetical protein
MVAILEPRVAAVRYSDVIEATLARALRGGTRDLIEPRVDDPKRALAIVSCLVETLTGFAIGSIAGEVFGGVRTWFGDDELGALRRRLGSGWPVACTESVAAETPYLVDAANRPLVDELARKLHVRFCCMSRDVEELVAAVRSSVAPERGHRVGVMFDLLMKEENVEQRVVAELGFGWSMGVAAMAGRPFPSRQQRTARSQQLWLAWEHALCGAPVLTRGEIEQAGYIMLVA